MIPLISRPFGSQALLLGRLDQPGSSHILMMAVQASLTRPRDPFPQIPLRFPAANETRLDRMQMQKTHRGGRAAADLATRAVPSLLNRSGAEATHALFSLAYHAQPHLGPDTLHDLLQRATAELRAGATAAKPEASRCESWAITIVSRVVL